MHTTYTGPDPPSLSLKRTHVLNYSTVLSLVLSMNKNIYIKINSTKYTLIINKNFIKGENPSPL